jgi:hypothetical protein
MLAGIGAICAKTILTGYTTGMTSGPIAATCALTVAVSARIFATEIIEKRAATVGTFAGTSVICTKTGATCARIVATSVTTAAMCVAISENKDWVGGGKTAAATFPPPFF